MAGVTEAREQLIEAMKNAYVSAQMYFPDDPIEALVTAMLDNPASVLKALDPAALRDWFLDNAVGVHEALIQRQIEARNAEPFTKITGA